MSARKVVRVVLLLVLLAFVLGEILLGFRYAMTAVVLEQYPVAALDENGTPGLFDTRPRRKNDLTIGFTVQRYDEDLNLVDSFDVRTPDLDCADRPRERKPFGSLLSRRPPALPVVAHAFNEASRGRAHSWSVRSGRLVCVAKADREILAGFGPDGWREGADAGEGAGFDPDARIISRGHGQFWDSR